ncbi:MAG: serine/threonine-protein phosphatase [Gemmatimonadota bacterium]|jgi:protein phosphatase
MVQKELRIPARLLTGKPRDEEIDVHGLTHTGKVRPTNQDHFLICSLRKKMDVFQTSLPGIDELPAETERLAFLAMVADGVGSSARGEEASRHAVEAVTQYLTHSMHCYYTADSADDNAFADALQEAALQCHADLMSRTGEDPSGRSMATTLTLYLGVWPRVYLLQVGDSRYYLLRDGRLTQVTRDQTIAQDLLDSGVLGRNPALSARWSNVLSSAIGGPEARPVVTAIANDWSNVHMMCSDGLTKHVSDARIRERLLDMTSARQACEGLLQDALDGGGTDNITIIVGRTLQKE